MGTLENKDTACRYCCPHQAPAYNEVGGLFHVGPVGIIMSCWLGAINYGVIVASDADVRGKAVEKNVAYFLKTIYNSRLILKKMVEYNLGERVNV